MTIREDVHTIRTHLELASGVDTEATRALERLERVLPEPDPEPTLWEQFLEFPIGTVFQIESEGNYTFVKTGDRAVVWIDHGYAIGPVVRHYGKVNHEFPHWKDSTTKAFEVL